MRKIENIKLAMLAVSLGLMAAGVLIKPWALRLLILGFSVLIMTLLLEVAVDLWRRRSDQKTPVSIGRQLFTTFTITGDGMLIGDDANRALMRNLRVPGGQWHANLTLGMVGGQHGIVSVELEGQANGSFEAIEDTLAVDSGVVILMDEAFDRRGVKSASLRPLFPQLWDAISHGSTGAVAIRDAAGNNCGILFAMAGGDGLYGVRCTAEGGQAKILVEAHSDDKPARNPRKR